MAKPRQIKLLSAKFHTVARPICSPFSFFFLFFPFFLALSVHGPDRLWSQTSSRNQDRSLFVRLSTAFFPPPASLPLHSGAFSCSSLGVSNHSLAATKRRFPAGLGADDDPALAAATNGDFVSADKGVK